MSYASIMVQVDVTGELNGRVRVAGQLADRFQSHLIGISSWMPRPPFTVEGVVIDPMLSAEELVERTKVLDQRGRAFKSATGIDERCLEWRSSQEFPSEHIAREARTADLVIISRERPAYNPYIFPDPGELLLRVGRPVLAVPPSVNSLNGRRVVVAWAERVRSVEGTAAGSLLRLVQDESADPIVAGAYWHTRLGEWIFGGMTQALLAESPVCCLLSH